MSKFVKITMGLALISFAGACARQPEPEPVFTQPAPIVQEPVYSKY